MVFIKTKNNNSFLDSGDWKLVPNPRLKTLQYFITSRCNQRCDGCFFEEYLGSTDVSFDEYKEVVERKVKEDNITKVNLIGGEPTLHHDLESMIRFNSSLGIRSHIYTNGAKLEKIPKDLDSDLLIRLSILSYDGKSKSIKKVKTNRPITILYAVNKYDIEDVKKVMQYCDDYLNVKQFVFTTWNSYDKISNFYDKSSREITLDQYLNVINIILNNYGGKTKRIHMGHCGFLELPFQEQNCSFTNRLPNQKECSCPLDIPLGNFSDKAEYIDKCEYSDNCFLQGIAFVND